MIFLEEQFSVVEYEKEWIALQNGNELPQENRSLPEPPPAEEPRSKPRRRKRGS
jgi:hypothetical protein